MNKNNMLMQMPEITGIRMFSAGLDENDSVNVPVMDPAKAMRGLTKINVERIQARKQVVDPSSVLL